MLDRRALIATLGVGLALPSRASAGTGATEGVAELKAVDEAVKALVDQGRLPFAAIQVTQRGRTLLETRHSGAGVVRPDTIFRIYSMTKPIAAAAVVLLIEDGRLTLDTPVADIVPELADMGVARGSLTDTEPARPMTVGHLLTHTSGISNSWNPGVTGAGYRAAGLAAGTWMFDPAIAGLTGFAERVAKVPLAFQPGQAWLYGYSLDIAGLIVERLSNMGFGAFLRRRLFDPLAMPDTGFSVREGQAARLADLYGADGRTVVERGAVSAMLSPPVSESGSAGLVSTLSDYGRFAAMVAGGGTLDGVRVMQASSIELLTAPYGDQTRVAPALARFGGIGLGGSGAGLGQALGGVTALDDAAGPGSRGEYAWGGAASTTFWATPGLGLSVVVMTQLLPSGTVPLRDILRPLVYAAVDEGR